MKIKDALLIKTMERKKSPHKIVFLTFLCKGTYIQETIIYNPKDEKLYIVSDLTRR